MSFVGTWSYRSLINNPDLSADFSALEFGQGTLVLTELEPGRVGGTIGGPCSRATRSNCNLPEKARWPERPGSTVIAATSCRTGQTASTREMPLSAASSPIRTGLLWPATSPRGMPCGSDVPPLAVAARHSD